MPVLVLLLSARLAPGNDAAPSPGAEEETGAAAPAAPDSIVTTDVNLNGEESQSVGVPRKTTFLHVDSWADESDGGDCDTWAGSYRISSDGSFALEPSAGDGPRVRVTWLRIE
jgi:hypothetical protein